MVNLCRQTCCPSLNGLETFLKKVAGMNDVEDALQRLDKLEQGELRTVIAQVARDTSGLKDGACPFSLVTPFMLTIL